MPVEKSAGAVIYRWTSEGPLFLLLHYEEGHWDFPKGHREAGEKTEGTIRREVREETGITRLTFVRGFNETIRYFFWAEKKRILKFVVYYLARTDQEVVALSPEHVAHEWLPFSKAQKKITFATSRSVLQKARARLHSVDKDGA
ncbi:MAG: NUDIX domain-containing protein [Candidatus Omnitrophota bacterium]